MRIIPVRLPLSHVCATRVRSSCLVRSLAHGAPSPPWNLPTRRQWRDSGPQRIAAERCAHASSPLLNLFAACT